MSALVILIENNSLFEHSSTTCITWRSSRYLPHKCRHIELFVWYVILYNAVVCTWSASCHASVAAPFKEMPDCSEIDRWHYLAQSNRCALVSVIEEAAFRFVNAARTHKDGRWWIFNMNWACRSFNLFSSTGFIPPPRGRSSSLIG